MIHNYLMAFIILSFMGIMDYYWKDLVLDLNNKASSFVAGVIWGSIIWGISWLLLTLFTGWYFFSFVFLSLIEDTFYYIFNSIYIYTWLHKWTWSETYYLPCVIPHFNNGSSAMPMKKMFKFLGIGSIISVIMYFIIHLI